MIQYFGEDVAVPSLDEMKTTNWLISIAKKHKKEIENINYIFCSDEYLLKINQDYLQHDFYTDIITFPIQDSPIVSDIFISVERVSENAKKLELTSDQELKRVLVHGLLHLIGFDDKSEELKEKMRMEENKSLEDFYALGQ